MSGFSPNQTWSEILKKAYKRDQNDKDLDENESYKKDLFATWKKKS